MQPIPTSLRLPEIHSDETSNRVLAFNKGEWEIGRLLLIEDGEPPIWSFDNEQSVIAEVSHWLPLPAPAWIPCAICGKPMTRVHASDFDGWSCMGTPCCVYRIPITS